MDYCSSVILFARYPHYEIFNGIPHAQITDMVDIIKKSQDNYMHRYLIYDQWSVCKLVSVDPEAYTVMRLQGHNDLIFHVRDDEYEMLKKRFVAVLGDDRMYQIDRHIGATVR